MLGCAVWGGSRAVPEQTEQIAPYSPNPSCALLVKDKLFIVPGIQMPFLVLRSVYASRTTGRASCILTYGLCSAWNVGRRMQEYIKLEIYLRGLINKSLCLL